MIEGADMEPSEAFGLVASETRFNIVHSLWDLTKGPDDDTVSFETLRNEAGIRDSGQFNYHLDKLTPQFVRKVETGYRLTSAGRRVVGAAVSGVYTEPEATMEPQGIGDCPECDGVLEIRYEDGLAVVSCRDCTTRYADLPAPPVLVATHDADELPGALSRHLLTGIQRTHRGFCLHCGGPLESTIFPREGRTFSTDWNVRFTCRACGGGSWSVVTGAVIDHPAVVSLLHEAGYDIRETPLWEIDPLLTATETLISEDPLRFRTTLSTESATLELTVDGDLELVGYERRERMDE